MESTVSFAARGLARRCLLCLAAVAAAAVSAGEPPSGGAGAPRPAAEYLLLPARLHLLRAREGSPLHCRLSEAEARRILARVNEIWRPGGLQFFAEGVRVETAAAQDLFDALGTNRTEAHLRLVRPAGSRSDRVFHVYYIGEMRPNGICLGGSFETIFVKESARLNPVPGGIEEPLPRVTAHEIGHALDLDHQRDRERLMASGTNGIRIDDVEIATARSAARRLPWTLTPAAALQRARETDGPRPAAEAGLLSVLASLPPGEISAEAARLRAAME